MPAETKADTETEVWAKISLPTSEGLRGELPAAVPSGDVIQKGDARATTFPIRFPVDPQTGRRLPAQAELRADVRRFRDRRAGGDASRSKFRRTPTRAR